VPSLLTRNEKLAFVFIDTGRVTADRCGSAFVFVQVTVEPAPRSATPART